MFKGLLSCVILLGSTFAVAQQRPAITGIAFMRVYTTDAAAAQHFYGDTLGYGHIEKGTEAIYPVNRSQWIEVLATTPPKANVRMAAVAFTTSDARALQAYLQAHGVSPVEPLHNGEFSVRDPEGNLIIFVQAGSQKLIPATLPADHAPSHRIIHVGFIVQDRQRENAFWRDVLGFKPYWVGGQKADTDVDYVSQQVPDGTDWLEFMLNQSPDSNLQTHGVMDHFSLGVSSMGTVVTALAANHCEGPNCSKTQVGRDGKVQLNLFDPDLTRVEYMEFKPSNPVCCTPFTGPHPSEADPK